MTEVYSKYKKGLMGSKLVHEDRNTNKTTQIKMPKKSKVNLKVLENCFMVYNGKEAVSPEKFSEAYFDDNNPNLLIAKKHDRYYSKMMVDCITGNHTPLCKSIENDYCVDHKDNILKISRKDCTTSSTGLVRVDYDVISNFMLCKNPKNKYVFLDQTDLEPIFYKEFNNPNVKCTLKVYNSNDIIMRVFSDKKQHYLVDNNQNILLTLEGDSVEEVYTYNQKEYGPKIQYFKCYDKEKNKTTLVKYNKTTEEVLETKVINNNVEDVMIIDDKTYISTYDKNNKIGVVDEDNKIVIPHKYDNLELQVVRSKYRDDFCPILKVNVGDKIGVLSLDGKTLLPCKYSDIIFSESRKYEDMYRFFAANEKNLYGVVNSNGQVEADFIYQNTCCTAPFYDKGANPSTYRHALRIRNTKSNKMDYLTLLEKDSVHKAEDIIEYSYGNDDDTPRKVKKTIEVPKYTEGEIIQQSIINGIIVDSPIGAIITAGIMKDQTVTKEIEVEENSRDY